MHAYVRTSVALFLFSYSQVTAVVLQYLHCVDAGDGESVVFSSPSIHCVTPRTSSGYPSCAPHRRRHRRAAGDCGVPVAQAPLLWSSSTTTTSTTTITTGSGSSATKPDEKVRRFKQRWGVLFEPYQPSMYGWQVAVLVRRVVCVLLSPRAGPAPASSQCAVCDERVAETAAYPHLPESDTD